jgi:tetratricopeptide (TPR) repeat protein
MDRLEHPQNVELGPAADSHAIIPEELTMRRLPQEVLYESARVLFKRRNYRKALEVLEQAFQVPPVGSRGATTELLYNLKIACLAAMGKEAEAIEAARNCLRKHPHFSDVRSNYKKLQRGNVDRIRLDDTLGRNLKAFRSQADHREDP